MTSTLKELTTGDEDSLTAAFSLIVPEWADRLVASPDGVAAFLADEASFVFVAQVDREPAGLAYTYLMRYPEPLAPPSSGCLPAGTTRSRRRCTTRWVATASPSAT